MRVDVVRFLPAHRCGLRDDIVELFDRQIERTADLQHVVHRRAADGAIQYGKKRRVRHVDLRREFLEIAAVRFDQRLDIVLTRHDFASFLRPLIP